MENRVLYNRPPDGDGYGTLKVPDLTFATIGGVGDGFSVGIVIGFFYNFIKGGSCCGLSNSRLYNALAKAPSMGGSLALFSLGHCLTRNAYFKYSGVTPHGDIIPYEIHGAAIGGALGFAHYGLRGASLGALTAGGVVAWYVLDEAYRTRYGSSICKTNTYSYRHYRHPHREDVDLPWPEALLYGSKLPED